MRPAPSRLGGGRPRFQLTFIALDTAVGIGLLGFAVWLALRGPVEETGPAR